MAISLEDELLPLKDVPSLLPGRPHHSTIWRWVTCGVRGIRLETISIGSRRFTSRSALQSFCDGLSRREALPSTARQGPDAKIEDALDRAGI
jgi:hypothetical protein